MDWVSIGGRIRRQREFLGYTREQSYETEKVPLEGSGLRLTVDANIQHYLENALDYAVKEHHVAARAVGELSIERRCR